MKSDIESFLTSVLEEVAPIGVKYSKELDIDFEGTYTNKFSKREQYIWTTGNRLIHLNNLFEEIEYGFKVFESSTIPEGGSDSYHHFIFCQRIMDYHISAVRDRTLQLVSVIFCVQKTKDQVDWKIFNDERVPKVVRPDFVKFSDLFKDYNGRKNNFFHRESRPTMIVSKDEDRNADFSSDFLKYKQEWEDISTREIKFFKNLTRIYNVTRDHFN